VSLWSRLGGRYKRLFKLYESYLWQPFLKGWFNGKDLTKSQPICEIKTVEERRPSHSTEDKTKLSNPENAVSEESLGTDAPIYPDWTPINFTG